MYKAIVNELQIIYMRMEALVEQIREQQKMAWNNFSPGWRKWDDFTMNFLRPMGDAIVKNLQLKDTDRVLDVATGTGEPGLTIARLVPNGRVIGIDLAEEMLAIAEEHASLKGLRNYETLNADVCELPFDETTFDAICCRMGFMFFPDMQLAASELYRVLKPGGRLSTAVWDEAQHNNWVTTIMSVIHKHIPPPISEPGAPGMFRCAEPGLMANFLERAGFKDIGTEQIKGKVDYQSFDRYWEIMLDIGAPIVAALSNADESTITKIRSEVAELFRSRNQDGESALDYAALVFTAVK